MAVTLITHNIKNGMVYRQYLATSDSEIEKMVENAQKAIKDCLGSHIITLPGVVEKCKQ